MKYLFFDIECANCFDRKGKIFSFGYVLTDENFNVIAPREDLLMDPDAQFDWYVVKKIMAYDKKIFKTKPKFDKIYPRLLELLDGAVAVGYNVATDVVYLLDECERYHLPPFELKFFDVQRLEQKESNEKHVTKLSLAYEKWCQKPAHDAHRSDVDAEMTMEVAKALCAHLQTDMDGVVAANPDFSGKTKDFFYAYEGEEMRDARDKTPRPHYRKLKPGQENFCLRGSRNAEMFARYAEQINKRREDAPKVCLSDNIESFDYNRAMLALSRLDAAGMGYARRPADAAVYVVCDRVDDNGEKRKCTKYNRARNLQAQGRLKMIDVADFEKDYPLAPDCDTNWDRFDAPEYAREVKRKKRKRR